MHLSRDRKKTTPGTTPNGWEGAELGRLVSEVRRDVDSLVERIEALSRVCATPAVSERLIVVEGPFVGDAAAALGTARLWLDRSQQMLAAPAQSLAQAHVAVGGVASRW